MNDFNKSEEDHLKNFNEVDDSYRYILYTYGNNIIYYGMIVVFGISAARYLTMTHGITHVVFFQICTVLN